MFNGWGPKFDALPTTNLLEAYSVATDPASKFSQQDIASGNQTVAKLDDLIAEVKAVNPPAEYADVHSSLLTMMKDVKELLGSAASMAQDGATVRDVQTKLHDKETAVIQEMATYGRKALAAGLVDFGSIDQPTGPSTTATAQPSTTMTTSAPTSTEATAPLTPGTGTRADPIRIRQEAQVGDWTMKVVSANLDSGSQIEKQVAYFQPPGSGDVYATVSVDATYTGGGTGLFWTDLNWEFAMPPCPPFQAPVSTSTKSRRPSDYHYFMIVILDLSKVIATAAITTIPVIAIWTYGSTPMMFMPFRKTPIIATPRSVRWTPPTPPDNAVPPITTAAMESSK